MTTQQRLRDLLASAQNSPDAATLSELLDSLSEGKEFPVNRLLDLNYSNMHLSLELIEDWRLQRYRYHHVRDYLNGLS